MIEAGVLRLESLVPTGALGNDFSACQHQCPVEPQHSILYFISPKEVGFLSVYFLFLL